MTSTETPRAARYVDDEDFLQALRGHESEVLKKLGIYTGVPLQGHDITGEAMKAWSLDLDQAKLMITKHILHRNDLVRVAAGDGAPDLFRAGSAPAAADGSGSRSELETAPAVGDGAGSRSEPERAPESDDVAPIASPGGPRGTDRGHLFTAEDLDALTHGELEPAAGDAVEPAPTEPDPFLTGDGESAEQDAAPQPLPGNGAEVLPPPEPEPEPEPEGPPTLPEVASWRARAWDAGYRPVAVYGVKNGRCFCHQPDTCKTPGKHPQGDRWAERARRDPPFAVEAAVNPKAPNTGILADGLRAMDGDIDDPAIAARIPTLAFTHFGPTIMRWRAGSARFLLLYRAAEGAPHKVSLAGKLGKIEMLGHGNQFVAHGMHPSGARLQWTPEPLTEVPVADLPAVTEAQIDSFFDAAAPLLQAERNKGNGAGPHATSSEGQRGDLFKVVRALEAIPNTGPANWEYFNKIGMATWAATNGAAAGFEVFCHWAQRHASFDPALCAERWQHYKTSPPTQIGAGTLIHLAREARQREADLAAKQARGASNQAAAAAAPAAAAAAPAAAAGAPSLRRRHQSRSPRATMIPLRWRRSSRC
jgi:hypothetical protein